MSTIRRHRGQVELARNFRVPRQATDEAIFDFLSSIDSPRSLAIWLLYSDGSKESHDQLTETSIKPDSYLSWSRFRDDYAATKFLSKANFLNVSFDRKKVALDKFYSFEEQCRQTNRRFRNLSSDPRINGPDCWLLNATRSKIEMILGDFSGEELVDDANWGPGVTTLLKGEYVSAVNKFHLENGITRDLHSLIGPLFDEAYPVWGNHLSYLYGSDGRFSFQVGNQVVTVPKDSKADRVIAVEPGINLWFQKGCGSMIRRRLRRFGIDLNTQENNQACAFFGSKDPRWCTVDFSSASDSISLELVRELLPPRWFLLLDSCRSKYGIVDKKPYFWEKFSSMGNGFTFELETLIFYAAALAVAEYQKEPAFISVFGDDVSIPTTCLPLYSSFCDFLGFTVNQKKSCYSGYFRESCGSHFWDGIDCKPIFLKERIYNVESVYKLANNIRDLAHRRNSHCGCDRRLLACWRHLVRRVPAALRFWVPRSLGDVGFAGNFDEATPPRARNGMEGYLCHTLQRVGLTDSLDSPAVLLARLRSPSMKEWNNSYTLRGRTKLRLTTVLVPRWCDFGAWW